MKKINFKQYALLSLLLSVSIAYASDTLESDIRQGRLSEKKGCHRQECDPCQKKILEEIHNTNCSLKSCCTRLSNGITNIENTVNTCCANLTADIATVNNNLITCCNTLESLIGNLSACGPVTPITQADIPLEITQPGRYCLAEDIVVNGNIIPPGIFGPIGIAINTNNVDLDLNNHTILVIGSGTTAVVTIGTSSHAYIHNGTIAGTGSPADQSSTGIDLLTNNCIVSDMQINNFSAFNGAGIIIGGLFVPTPLSSDILIEKNEGIIVERCNLSANYSGIALISAPTNNIMLRDCAIDKSLFVGINQPSRRDYWSNVAIENCSISNSAYHGIYTTYNQSNWILKNVQVSNSGLDGMILAGFQSLKLDNCQVSNSGSYGIIASIRQSQNVEISNCQVFNSQNGALRVDNVSNLLIKDCQLTNYIPSTEPLLKLQDIFNGSVRGCLFSSVDGTADGFFARNCQGLVVQNCAANIFCNQPVTNCPIGFNIHGGVNNAVIQNCNVSGNPSIGIAIVPDGYNGNAGLTNISKQVPTVPNNLNGTNSGIVVDGCTMQGVVNTGILLSNASSCTVSNCNVVDGAGDGITLDSTTTKCSVTGNKLTNNAGIGLNNEAVPQSGICINPIFHNFATCNGTNFVGVPLVVGPQSGVGVLDNISIVTTI